MSFPTRASFPRPARMAGLVLFVSLTLASAAAPAAETGGEAPTAQAVPSATSPPPLFAEESRWSWSKMLKPLEFVQGSRRNMIQLATVGMCIALYIIWWRRAA
jgi:hypothetical protein